jgi:polyphosphate kinase
VMQMLATMFADNVKARRLNADGSYTRVAPGAGEPPRRAQTLMQDEAKRRMAQARERAGVSFAAVHQATRHS